MSLYDVLQDMSSKANTPGGPIRKALRRARLPAVACAGALALALPARAQLGLPTATPTLPALPGSTLTRDLGNVVGQTLEPVEGTTRLVSSATRIRSLLRAHRAQLELDPNGALMVRARLVAVAPSASALDAARAAGFVVVDDQRLDELGIHVVQLAVPPTQATAAALRRLRALDPAGSYDYDHIYLASGSPSNAAAAAATAAAGPEASAPTTQSSPAATARAGLIDGGVDTQHPVFGNSRIERWGCAGKSLASVHGTAVASLMVGQASSFRGAAPGATLYAADVYCNEPTGGAVVAIVAALGWMAQQQVPVINVSLVGPDNLLLGHAIRTLQGRGQLIVAAVGNDGPAARPLYPAAYPGVIGVTGVDAHRHVLIEAGRGPQVRMAAPGADLPAAIPQGEYTLVRGTSFAAPIVAGLLVAALSTAEGASPAAALAQLESQAVDLGARGTDTTYGVGLVGETVRAALLASRLKLNQATERELVE